MRRNAARIAPLLMAAAAVSLQCTQPGGSQDQGRQARGTKAAAGSGAAWAAPGDDGPRVLDAAGQPVADARVWLCASFYGWREPEVLAEVTSDAEGRFRLEVEPRAAVDSYMLVAHKAGHALGQSHAHDAADLGSVVLPPPGRRRIRIVDARLRALPEAWAGICWLPAYPYVDPRSRFPEALISAFTQRADRGGVVSLSLCSDLDTPTLRVSAPGYAQEVLAWEEGDDDRIVLSEAATIEANLVCRDEPEAVGGRRVILTLEADGGGYGQGARYTATSDENGLVRRDDLPPGEYSIAVPPEPEDRWQTSGAEHVSAQGGEAAAVPLYLERAYRVSGRVVNEQGVGVPRIPVMVRARPRWTSAPLAITDESGVFTCCVLPGEVGVIPYGRLPEPYFSVGARRTMRVEAHDDNQAGDIELSTGPRVRGRVADEAGRPVAGAKVRADGGGLGVGRASRYFGYGRANGVCNAEGEFQTGPLYPAESYTLIAWSEDAITPEPVEIKATERDGVELIVERDAAAYVEGRVLSSDGAAIPRAMVSLHGVRDPASSYGGPLMLAEALTNEEGHFSFGPVLGGCPYLVCAKAYGHEPHETPHGWGLSPRDMGAVDLQPGERHDLGRIVLKKR